METARPLAFEAVRRPRMGDFLSALASYVTAKREVEPAEKV